MYLLEKDSFTKSGWLVTALLVLIWVQLRFLLLIDFFRSFACWWREKTLVLIFDGWSNAPDWIPYCPIGIQFWNCGNKAFPFLSHLFLLVVGELRTTMAASWHRSLRYDDSDAKVNCCIHIIAPKYHTLASWVSHQQSFLRFRICLRPEDTQR